MIETSVDAVRIRSPGTVAPDTTVTEAARLLCDPAVPALVVLEDGDVIGILTESDIVSLVAESDARPVVRTIMSTPVTTISPGATIRDAAETMRTAGVTQLPVVDDGVYRGLLSARTLAPYLSRRSLDIERRREPVRPSRSNRPKLPAGE
ncbi:cyclic nucleotide-binding/CBS domain-containing protein [Halosolutus amylolyticus]|uniref:Cyclic nucleotide-binding/CBS domain-containing protein n=1 Tax=Halosolutus amylolyticus TaxID=2932267 RepID=A0ABD5PUR9_9EURY|nr:CBS domain-containing protein [Halosolutus amylolyticus]